MECYKYHTIILLFFVLLKAYFPSVPRVGCMKFSNYAFGVKCGLCLDIWMKFFLLV